MLSGSKVDSPDAIRSAFYRLHWTGRCRTPAPNGQQYVFPAPSLSTDPRAAVKRRHHLTPNSFQRALRTAKLAAGIHKYGTPHTLQHSFAMHLLEDDYDIRTVQELLGHKNVATTMIYLHVMDRGALGVRSPLEKLDDNAR
jgi:integrase